MSSTTGNVVDKENYPTPIEHVRTLMRYLRFKSDDTFFEPCYGDHGAIYHEVPLPNSQKKFAEIRLGLDYLTLPFALVDVIITNPPFSLTCEFLRKSRSMLKPNGTLIYLQRVNFLGSNKRVDFWNEFGFPEKLSVLVPRPRFTGGNSDSCEYAWFIWDEGGRVNLPSGVSNIVCEELLR